MKRHSLLPLTLSIATACLLPAATWAQPSRFPSVSKKANRAPSRTLSTPTTVSRFRAPVTKRSSLSQPSVSTATRRTQQPGPLSRNRVAPLATKPNFTAPHKPSFSNRTPNLQGAVKPDGRKPGSFTPNRINPRVINPRGVTPQKPPLSRTVPNLPPNLAVRPITTRPIAPGALKPAPRSPLAPNHRLTKPLGSSALGSSGIREIQPDLTKLNGLRKFDTLVGKLEMPQKFTALQPNKLQSSLKALKNAQVQQLKSPQGMQAKSMAIQKLSLSPTCHWWFDFCIGWHWHHNHCHWWDVCYTPGYWNCWTPCRYSIVYCPPRTGYIACSWYFGVECVLIPDMASYGIQKVMPHSPAALAGLQPGDMINSINGFGIAEEGMLQREIQRSGGLLQLGVLRDGSIEPVLVDVMLRRVRTLSY